MSSPIHIPVLRLGRPYESLDKVRFTVEGREIAVSMANSGLIRRDLQQGLARAAESLQAIPCAKLADACEHAAELFLRGNLPWGDGDQLQSPQDYVVALSQLTGLPHSLGHQNMG